MQLQMQSEQFDVLVMPNPRRHFGTVAGQVGVRRGRAANLGVEIGVRGGARRVPDIAGGLANLTALLLSAVMTLRHIDEGSAADRIMAGFDGVTAGSVRTRDLGTASTWSSRTPGAAL